MRLDLRTLRGACAAGVSILTLSVTVIAGSAAAQPVRSTDALWIARPEARSLIQRDGQVLDRRVTPSGAFRGNAKGRVEIVGQRRGFDIVAAGFAAQEPERSRLIDHGLKAIEWGLSTAGPDGAFPASQRHASTVVPPIMFIEAASRTVLLIASSTVAAEQRTRAERLRPQIEKSALTILHSPQFGQFLQQSRLTNQRLGVALALQEAAAVTGNAELARASGPIVQQALAQQLPDGTLPEKGGFDTNYQSVSLEFLARYMAYSPAMAPQIRAALVRGTDRLTKAISPGGDVDASRNTRTTACGPAIDSEQAKGTARDALALRLFYVNAVLNNEAIAQTARSVQLKGQRFTHFEECPSAAKP